MSNIISNSEIKSIISNFDVSISEYEIVDMEVFQGWGTKHLYLLTSPNESFILKAKTIDQIAGYDDEVKICNALLKCGIQSRRPVLTKDGEIFYQKDEFNWSLMTYITGTPSYCGEYNENTIRSLAEHINQYVLGSLTNKNLQNLDIKEDLAEEDMKIMERLVKEEKTLKSNDVLNGTSITNLFTFIKTGYQKHLQGSQLRSVIHNDVNARNILIDHNTKNVVSLIDWDHVRYGNPLKDLSYAIAIFYDNLPFDTANKYKEIFYKSFTSEWFTSLNKNTVDFAFVFYYTFAKCQSILFYLNLLKKYDNKYGEEKRFVNEMKNTYSKWISVVGSFLVEN